MKINHEKNLDVNTIAGNFNSKEVSIDKTSMPFFFDIMSKSLYSNPIGSIVREITSNCFDSHIEAKIDDAVVIRKGYDDSEGYYISFNDFGVGLSPERIEKVYMIYFSSTKRGSNEEIGGFGLGSKTPFAYAEFFYIYTTHNGIKYEYIFHKGESIPTLDLLNEETTTNKNGTEIRIFMKDGDISKFKVNLQEQLCYFDNVVFEGWDINNEYKIYECTNFKYRNDKQYSEFAHICYGKVAYPIDFDQIQCDELKVPVGIKFEIGELEVTPSREAIRYTDKSRELIKQRLKSTIEELDNRFSSQKLEFEDLEEYIQYQTKRASIKLGDSEDKIYLTGMKLKSKGVFTPLKNYPELKIENTNFLEYLFKGKGVLNFKKKSLVYQYFTVSNLNNYREIYLCKHFQFTGTKGFKFQNDTFIDTIKVGNVDNLIKFAQTIGLVSSNYSRYNNLSHEILPLGLAKKVHEIRKILTKYIIDKYNIIDYETYIPTKEDEKAYQDYKDEKNLGKKRLDEGKILIQNLLRGEKEDWEVSSIKSRTNLVVYGHPKDKEKLDKAKVYFKWNFKEFFIDRKVKNKETKRTYIRNFRNIEIIQIAQHNAKYFKGYKNMVHVDDIYGDNRIFRRIATGIRISEFFRDILTYQTSFELNKFIEAFEKINSKVAKEMRLMERYMKDRVHNITIADHHNTRDFRKELLDISYKANLFDKSFVHIIEDVERYFQDAELLRFVEINNESLPLVLKYLKEKKKAICPEYYAKVIHKKEIEEGQLKLIFIEEEENKQFQLKIAS